jgi:hypothetical protein
VESINDREVVGLCDRVGLQNCLLTDDGKAVFLYNGKIRRHILGGKSEQRFEAVFFYNNDGKLSSYTTSQYSHLSKNPQGRLNPSAPIRLLGAAAGKSLALSAVLGNELRITEVNWDKRGNKPNVDFDVAARFAVYPVALGARHTGSATTWYVLQGRRNLSGKLYAITTASSKMSQTYLGDCGPGLQYSQYDPSSKYVISEANDGKFLLAKRGSAIAQATALPSKTAIPFLSRGMLFASADKVYMRAADKTWKSMGNFRLLSRNGSGLVWLVADRSGKVWRVKF